MDSVSWWRKPNRASLWLLVRSAKLRVLAFASLSSEAGALFTLLI